MLYAFNEIGLLFIKKWLISDAEADVASNGDTTQSALDGAFVEANSQIHKEQLDVERAISEITQQVCMILCHFYMLL